MMYAFVENGKVVDYPLGEYEIKSRFSHVSFATPFVPPEGYVVVVNTPQPEADYTKVVREDTPKLEGDKCVQTWVVADAPADVVEKRLVYQWESVRSQRKTKLVGCDWTQLPDAPVDAAAWAEYRQALRDITNQPDPFNIVWPKPPGA